MCIHPITLNSPHLWSERSTTWASFTSVEDFPTRTRAHGFHISVAISQSDIPMRKRVASGYRTAANSRPPRFLRAPHTAQLGQVCRIRGARRPSFGIVEKHLPTIPAKARLATHAVPKATMEDVQLLFGGDEYAAFAHWARLLLLGDLKTGGSHRCSCWLSL